MVEQVICWSYNNFVQYTIHLVGVSRAKIEKFAIPVSTVQQLYAIEGGQTGSKAILCGTVEIIRCR